MPDIENIQEENSKEKIANSNEEIVNENISQKQIETTKRETQNSQRQTEEMEVHHHPHVEKKNFKEYFLEFLMIFLAVTLGFFAESYREHLTDRSKEKEYIKSMVEDLETDSAFLALSINKLIPYHSKWLDSTIHLLSTPDLKGKDRQVYQAFMIGTAWSYNFHPTERTLSQLHSDGYHLIRNKNAATVLSQLEAHYKFESQTATLVDNLQNDIDLSAYIFADKVITDQIATTAFQHFSDSSSVELQLSDVPETATINTTDKEAIKVYVDKLKKYNFYLQYGIKGWDNILSKEINKAIAVLKKEYHLQDEEEEKIQSVNR